jgi:hypothetical protein
MKTHAAKRRPAFVRGFWSALSAPSQIYEVTHYRPHGALQDAMRSDWLKIGDDFRIVLGRYGEKATGETR